VNGKAQALGVMPEHGRNRAFFLNYRSAITPDCAQATVCSRRAILEGTGSEPRASTNKTAPILEVVPESHAGRLFDRVAKNSRGVRR
jgi:hypothetical protein